MMAEPTLRIFGGGKRSENQTEMTVREYARHEQVTVRTVYEWKKKGAVSYRTTPGGGLRIIVTENR